MSFLIGSTKVNCIRSCLKKNKNRFSKTFKKIGYFFVREKEEELMYVNRFECWTDKEQI
ncbi:hypothetical protein [Leptospira interrogans]|uniref:Uncharacterized protein n=1 Tax=Leptospira interrogans str. 2006001854 TaxID=1001590 RepID=M6G7M2_LEPIR|nr:hypothetical protein [Leptospira interrogans]EMM80993.1 hypothetical protein LEP1GSC037_0311 [Leptospira interrogans str. 2006001854]UMQ52685.1 hypothetical protein FH582_01620 [Leptospira interrogans]